MTGFAIGLLITSALATTYSTMAASNAAAMQAKAQESAIKTQELETEYKNTKQRKQQIQQLHTQLAENEMVATQRGLSLASPSFNAIQMTTYNNTAQALEDNVQAQHIESLSSQSKMDSLHVMAHEKQNQIFWGGVGQLSGEASQIGRVSLGSASESRGQGFNTGYNTEFG